MGPGPLMVGWGSGINPGSRERVVNFVLGSRGTGLFCPVDTGGMGVRSGFDSIGSVGRG